MADRLVARSDKDRDGDITALCGSFVRTPKATAIREINNRTHTYYTNVGGRRTNVRVVTVGGVQHLTTNADGYKPNNLDNLPPC